MSTETVTIGCKLPHGMILEVGYETTKEDKNGREFVSLRKLPHYQRKQIRGASHADGTRAAYAAGLFLPARLNPGVGLTKIPKDFWDAWKKSHPEMVKRLEGVLFEAKDDASAKAQVIDAAKAMTRFEPLDPTKLPVHGIKKFDPDVE